MLKGVKKGEVNKNDYEFKEHTKGYYKVINKKTSIYRIMSKDKVESIFGKMNKKEKKEQEEIDIDELISSINLETFKTKDLSIEEKQVIKDKCIELNKEEIKSYKDMVKFLKEQEDN